MANLFRSCSLLLSVSLIIILCVPSRVNCTEFEVGGHDGWIVPKSRDNDQMYNQWASQNRFKVDDTLRFKYSKDSVLVVSEEEYESCRSTKPLFFSNNGDTVFKFEHPGVYYFISGVRGHCDKGQKMIVKVLAVHNPKPEPPHSHSPTPAAAPAFTSASTPAPSPSHHSNAGRPIPLLSITNLPLFLILLLPMLFA